MQTGILPPSTLIHNLYLHMIFQQKMHNVFVWLLTYPNWLTFRIDISTMHAPCNHASNRFGDEVTKSMDVNILKMVGDNWKQMTHLKSGIKF